LFLDFEVGVDKLDLSALGINANQILIQSATVNGINGSIVTEDVNGNGQADTGEFAVDVIINGAGFVTVQDMLLQALEGGTYKETGARPRPGADALWYRLTRLPLRASLPSEFKDLTHPARRSGYPVNLSPCSPDSC
jgi:hypothetical protein